TIIFSVARLTLALITPANFLVAFSTLWTQEAHVIPVIAKVFFSVSVTTLYPALSTAAWISSSDTTFSSKLIFNFSVARFTLDSCTPDNFLVAFSTVCTQEAHVIPSTLNVFVVIHCQLLYLTDSTS